MSDDYALARKEDDIDDLLDRCDALESEGTSLFPSMTYEQGVAEAIRWLLGFIDEDPLTD